MNSAIPDCHFCYWVGGRQVGNLDFEAPMCEIAADLRHVLQDRGLRKNDELYELPSQELVSLMEKWYEDGDGLIAAGFRWSSYDIGYSMGHGYPLGEGVRFSVYLVESGAWGRIIVSCDEKQQVLFEQRVEAGVADRVLFEAWQVVNSF